MALAQLGAALFPSLLGFAGNLFGGGQRSSGSNSSFMSNFDPQDFLSKYADTVNPIYDRVYSTLDNYRDSVNKETEGILSNFSNDRTRSEFTNSFGSNFDNIRSSIASGFMTPEEAKNSIASSALNAGIKPGDTIYKGNTLSGVMNFLQDEEIANRPVEFARGVSSTAQNLLGRAATKQELARYTPEQGFTNQSQVAQSMMNSLEGQRRNPEPFLNALGTLTGGGVQVTRLNAPKKNKKESGDSFGAEGTSANA
jgi:hypothetical protein